MRDYVILTDSCCDLPAELAEELGVEVLPMNLELDGQSYRSYLDGRELPFPEFYARIRSGGSATTAAISVGDYEERMRPILESGRDILCLCFSSALSSTYQSACIAAQELQEDFPGAAIEVVDSLSASLGQGLFVYLCAREKQRGADLTALRAYAEATRGRVCHWFTVDDLNHLKRGGRVSPAAAMFGTMLSIKPVLHVDDQGRLIPVSKARGRKASLLELVERMEKTAVDPPDRPCSSATATARRTPASWRTPSAAAWASRTSASTISDRSSAVTPDRAPSRCSSWERSAEDRKEPAMNWLEVHIDTNHMGLEPVETMLSSLDIDGVVIDDETEFQDFLENNREYWDYVDEDLESSMKGKSRITFYLPADETGFAKLGEVRIALAAMKEQRQDCGTLLMTMADLQDADWENNWKQYYKPMEIGRRLLVVPQWEQAEAGERVPLI